VTTVHPEPPAAEMGTLLRELNHRIANQFASAIDLISIEAVRAEGAEAKAALSGAVELLHGHADVHRALSMPRQRALVDAATYLRKLCGAFQGAVLDRLDIQLTLKGDRLPLQPERCWRLGLIIHQLVTNATSHAFDGRSGEIRIRLAHADGLIRCVVSDNGSAASRATQGPGLRIVADLARTLDGRIEHAVGGRLRSVVLCFPPTERERHAHSAIDRRRVKLSCEKKPAQSGLARKGRAGSFDRVIHPGAIANVQAAIVPPASQGGAPSRAPSDMLAQLFSPSYSTDAP